MAKNVRRERPALGSWLATLTDDEIAEWSRLSRERIKLGKALDRIRQRAKQRLRRQERAAGNQTEQNKHT
jgi:predicted Fe-S protein YdhL (DUF1289 family)